MKKGGGGAPATSEIAGHVDSAACSDYPRWTPDEAANLILETIVKRPRRVKVGPPAVLEMLYTIQPELVEALVSRSTSRNLLGAAEGALIRAAASTQSWASAHVLATSE